MVRHTILYEFNFQEGRIVSIRSGWKHEQDLLSKLVSSGQAFP